MPYANLSGLTARYGAHMLIDLTDRAMPPTGHIDVDVVQAVLEDTDALIDGYLAGRYALPLVETPRLLATVAEVVAIYKLHISVVPDKIRRRLQGPAQAPDGDRRRRRAVAGRGRDRAGRPHRHRRALHRPRARHDPRKPAGLDLMDGVRVELRAETALNTLSEAAQRLSQPLQMWQAIGRAMVDSTRWRFDAGEGPGGVAWKPSHRAKSGEGKTLIGLSMAGGLMGSVAYEADESGVRWRSNMIHARIHQLGGVIKPKNGKALVFKVGGDTIFAGSVTIPARPYLGVDAEDEAMIEDIAADAIDAAFGGARDAG